MKARFIYLLVCVILIGIIINTESQNLKDMAQGDTEPRTAINTIAGGAFTYYAIGHDSTLYAWGERYPQSPNLETATPILQNAVCVSAGWRGCIAIDDQGTLWNMSEYLLDQSGPYPQRVMDKVKGVAVGLNHFVFLTTDGDVYVCGRNSEYQLTGSVEVDETSQYSPPVYIMGGVKDIAATDDGCCVLMDNGDLFYWGTFVEYTAPEPILIGQNFDSLPCGIWAVKKNELYMIAEIKTADGPELTTERILENVKDVYNGIVRTSNENFFAAITAPDVFQKVSLPQDITYAYLADQILIRRNDGSIEQIEYHH